MDIRDRYRMDIIRIGDIKFLGLLLHYTKIYYIIIYIHLVEN